MLTAMYEKKIIYVSDLTEDHLKKASENKQLRCPDCNEVIIYKNCQGKQNHFSHHNSDCSSPFSEPESLEHQNGKQALFDWLKQQFGNDDAFIERKVEQTNQRSDTFVLSLNTAVEFQCSPIQAKTWETRHLLYQSAKINDIWVLGYSMHKYQNSHPYMHKLNSLEESMLEAYGKIFYYNVLTSHFVFLIPGEKLNRTLTGREYFFKPEEVFLKDGKIQSKYDFFIGMQDSRRKRVESEFKKAQETDSFIKEVRQKKEDAPKVLATAKQINYIKHLLIKNERKIPYKLHGMTKSEASLLIEELSK